MLRHLPSTAYECCVPIGEIDDSPYNSPIEGRGQSESSRRANGSARHIYPAWPDIHSRWNWLSFPTLFRGVFVPGQRSVGLEVYENSSRINSLLELYRTSTEPNFDPNFSRFAIQLVRDSASTYGYGPEDAFGLIHEGAHFIARSAYSAFQQEKQTRQVHSLLAAIAIEQPESQDLLEHMWNAFGEANERLVHLVRKYESYEELFATIVALKFLPDTMVTDLKPQLETILKSKNLYKQYLAWEEGNDKLSLEYFVPVQGAKMNFISIFYDCFGYDPLTAEASEQFDQDFEQTQTLFNKWVEQLETSDIELPVVLLTGAGSSITVNVFRISGVTVTSADAAVTTLVNDTVFWESIRQQISQLRGFYCPFASKDAHCCGRHQLLRNLFNRLPDEDRTKFSPALCTMS